MRTTLRAVLLLLLAFSLPSAFSEPMGWSGGGGAGTAGVDQTKSAEGIAPPIPSSGMTEAPFSGGAKSLANGIYIAGPWVFQFSGSVVNITVSQVNNTTTSYTTGTLRFSLWATTYQPARTGGVTGYRLAVFPNLGQLLPGNSYTNISQSAVWTAPPNGTYWIVLVLDEYDPANCPTSSDGFCAQDLGVSVSQETYGPPTPPSSLENPAANSYQSGIGLISGWSCQGPVTVTVDGTSISAPYGGPRGDTASVCSGNTSTGFGLLVNYNNFGPGVHTAQLYVNGIASGSPHTFNVTVPSGEFMTGLSRSVTVPDFPTPGRTTILIWQESQQNFAIQSVFP